MTKEKITGVSIRELSKGGNIPYALLLEADPSRELCADRTSSTAPLQNKNPPPGGGGCGELLVGVAGQFSNRFVEDLKRLGSL